MAREPDITPGGPDSEEDGPPVTRAAVAVGRVGRDEQAQAEELASLPDLLAEWNDREDAAACDRP